MGRTAWAMTIYGGLVKRVMADMGFGRDHDKRESGIVEARAGGGGNHKSG